MANSVFRDVIEFFGILGIYDVLLPFLLTFVIMFAILEKSKVFGTEGGGKYTRKNLNSIASFVVGLLVVGSGQLVSVLNQAVAQVFILVVIGVLFMALVGVFHGEGGFKEIGEKYRWAAMLFAAVGIALIFLNAIPLRSGVSVLEYVYSYVINNATGTVVGTIILLVILVGGMYFITRKQPGENE